MDTKTTILAIAVASAVVNLCLHFLGVNGAVSCTLEQAGVSLQAAVAHAMLK